MMKYGLPVSKIKKDSHKDDEIKITMNHLWLLEWNNLLITCKKIDYFVLELKLISAVNIIT